MKSLTFRLFAITILALSGMTAVLAQGMSTTRYPEYQRVYEPSSQQCYEVVTERQYNPAGAIIGGVVGYAIGRELDRDGRGYGYHNEPRRHYAPGRGYYYRNHGHYYPRYESRGGRVAGAVIGGYVGSQAGRGERVERVCERERYPQYREVLVGYRVVVRYPNGSTREFFEPLR